MVDEAVFFAKITDARRHIDRIRNKAPASEEIFLADRDTQDIVLHNLQHAIQDCIDVASHVVADEGLGQPSSLRDVFELLVAHRLLEQSLAASLEQAVGLRNLMIHEYAQLDLPRVYRAATEDIADLEEFVHEMVDRFGAETIEP
jgi:uncharacterized protein YutE (UPF0331/DUF86 family)